jgi:hypothetical protein
VTFTNTGKRLRDDLFVLEAVVSGQSACRSFVAARLGMTVSQLGG